MGRSGRGGYRIGRILCLLLVWGLMPAVLGAEAEVEVQIQGIRDELLDNVRASLSLYRESAGPWLSPERIETLHRQAPAEIREALEPFGYYRPQIESSLSPPDATRSQWQADYRIEPREPLPIGRLNLEFSGAGREDQAIHALASRWPLPLGATLNHPNYEQAKRELLRSVRNLGYLDAELRRHQVEVDLESYQAHIDLLIETGPRYRFGALSFQQDIFAPAFLQGFVPFVPGEPFTADKVARLRRGLSRSGYFQQVEIERLAPSEETPTEIPLEVKLEPFKPNRYRIRLGWGTDTGVGSYFDWDRRYLGQWGQGFDLGALLVQFRRKLVLDLNYHIPIDPLQETQLEVFARHQGKDLDYTDVDLNEGGDTRIINNSLGLSWLRPRSLWGGRVAKEVWSLTYLTESYDVFPVLFGNLAPDVQDLIASLIGKEARATMAPEFSGLVPALSWTLSDSDDVLYPRDGDFFKLELRGARKGLASNFSFWQTRLRAVAIRPLFERDRLLMRGDLAYTQAETKTALGALFNQMPELYEFRTGGDRSVRGYGYETLYPRDAITGAKHQLVASLEYDRSILPDWSAALFLDLGNAFNDYSQMDIHWGTGIGARWRSPVGLIRLDLGIPLSDAKDAFRIHLVIGPEF